MNMKDDKHYNTRIITQILLTILRGHMIYFPILTGKKYHDLCEIYMVPALNDLKMTLHGNKKWHQNISESLDPALVPKINILIQMKDNLLH